MFYAFKVDDVITFEEFDPTVDYGGVNYLFNSWSGSWFVRKSHLWIAILKNQLPKEIKAKCLLLNISVE